MRPENDEPPGDPVCWLTLVCDTCGALREGVADSCWRCGTPLTPPT